MAFIRVAEVLVYVFIIALLGGCAGTIVKRNQQAIADTSTTQQPQQTCVADPGLERRTILLEEAATTWGATLPPMLERLSEISNSLQTPPSRHAAGMDCTDLYQQGYNKSGIYTVAFHRHSVAPHKSFYAICDMETDGGGWTVIQRRLDGSTDFYRGWEEYKKGFGHMESEYWLGLDHIYLLTSFANYELRVDLEAFDGSQVYAKYDNFRISDELENFKLTLGSYSGTAGDALSYSRNDPFTTKDRDNDDHYSQNCAQLYKGAWWYYECFDANLNGLYLGADQDDPQGVVWQQWKDNEALKAVDMKIRRKS